MNLPITVVLILNLYIQGLEAEISSPPTNTFGTVGKSVTIKCTVPGGGLSWQFYAIGAQLSVGIDTTNTNSPKHVISNPTTGQYDLVIKSVQQNDAGLYVCQDKQLTSKGMYFSVITTEPSADVSHTDSSPLPAGQTVTTTCKASFVSRDMDLEITANDGTKTETATSTSTNSYTSKDATKSFTQTAALPNVPAVTCTYKFKYAPVLTADPNIDKSTTSATTVTTPVLTVWECVKDIAVTPVASMYKAGDQLTCTAAGFPDPTFRWDGTASPTQNGATFTVPNTLTVGQSYTYTCTADNSQSGFSCTPEQQSVTFNLAACAATPTISPVKATYLPGQTLTCSSVGFPQPTYVWKDGSGAVLANSATYTVPTSLTAGQSYTYKCEATNNQPSFTCPTVDTEVNFQAAKCPSNVQVSPVSDNYLPGATVVCTAQGFPTPTMQWIDLATTLTVSSTATLTIPSTLTPGQTYNYRCVASNAPADNTCTPGNVDIQFSAAECAKNTNVSPEKVQYNPGETVTCTADGTPTPTFKWVDVDTGLTVSSTATITLPTDGSKTYNYRCEATNTPTGGSCSVSSKTIQFTILTTTTTSTTTTTLPPGVSTTTTKSTPSVSGTSGSTPSGSGSSTKNPNDDKDEGWENIYLIPILLVPLLALLGCLGCTYCCALWPFGAYRKHRHEHAIVEVAQAEHAIPVRYYPSVDGSVDFSSKYKYWPSPDEQEHFRDGSYYGSATGIHTYTAN